MAKKVSKTQRVEHHIEGRIVVLCTYISVCMTFEIRAYNKINLSSNNLTPFRFSVFDNFVKTFDNGISYLLYVCIALIYPKFCGPNRRKCSLFETLICQRANFSNESQT